MIIGLEVDGAYWLSWRSDLVLWTLPRSRPGEAIRA